MTMLLGIVIGAAAVVAVGFFVVIKVLDKGRWKL